MKLYTLRLKTIYSDIEIANVEEFIFSKRSLFYKSADGAMAIPRTSIIKAFRRLDGQSDWIEIRDRKKFK